MSSYKQSPDITVILLCFNHARFVEQSLRAFEQQQGVNFELIIVDDCSHDDSVDIIKKWSAHTSLTHTVIANDINQGICKNINTVLSVTSGEFVTVISSDDWPDTDYLSRMHEVLIQADRATAFVFADVREVDEMGVLIDSGRKTSEELSEPHVVEDFFHQLLAANAVSAPAVMMRRSAIVEVGGYDETLLYEDYDMWLKLTSHFKAIHLPRELVNYRILTSSLSHSSTFSESRKVTELRLLAQRVDSTPRANAIIALHLRSLCSELVAEGFFKSALPYLKLANNIDPRLRWAVFTQLVRIPGVRHLLRRRAIFTQLVRISGVRHLLRRIV